jgi:RHS repeat-associated protein
VGAYAGIYDDRNPQIVYSGPWTWNLADGRYDGTQTFSHVAGSTASFTFTGTRVTYLYEAQWNMGHAQVSIDGNVVTPDVDEFAAVGQQQQRLTYSGLGNGTHTITVTVLGTSDAQSADSYVIIDAFIVEAPPAWPCATCYLSYDHLGSVRMVTDQNANVIARHDYLPFGEEIPGNTAGRDSTFGAPDNVNQKFTGQERDAETSLDFFQARYYASGVMRFMSPDPLRLSAFLDNPQSWNMYSYAYNRPLEFVDNQDRPFTNGTILGGQANEFS